MSSNKAPKKTFGQKELFPLIAQRIKDNTAYSAAQLIKNKKRKYKVDFSYSVCYAAKQNVLAQINGESAANFTRLRKFLLLLMEKNPGTIAQVEEIEWTFRRAFLPLLQASIR